MTRLRFLKNFGHLGSSNEKLCFSIKKLKKRTVIKCNSERTLTILSFVYKFALLRMVECISKRSFGPKEEERLRTLRLILAKFLEQLRLLFAKKLRTPRLKNKRCSYKKTGVYSLSLTICKLDNIIL